MEASEWMTQQHRFPKPPDSHFGPLCLGLWRRDDGSECTVEGWSGSIVRFRRADGELRQIAKGRFLVTHELIERARK